jgi:hypothetical protein
MELFNVSILILTGILFLLSLGLGTSSLIVYSNDHHENITKLKCYDDIKDFEIGWGIFGIICAVNLLVFNILFLLFRPYDPEIENVGWLGWMFLTALATVGLLFAGSIIPGIFLFSHCTKLISYSYSSWALLLAIFIVSIFITGISLIIGMCWGCYAWLSNDD